MAKSGDLFIGIGATADPFKKAVKDASNAANGFTASFGGLDKAISSVFSGNFANVGKSLSSAFAPLASMGVVTGAVVGVAAAIAAVGVAAIGAGAAFAAMGLGQASVIDSANDLSTNLGMDVAELMKLEYAAKLSGSSGEEMDAALMKMQKSLSNLSAEGGASSEVLKRFGIDAAQLVNLSPDKQLLAISDAMSKVTSASDRTSIAVEIFGKQGAKLNGLLMQGSGAIKALGDELAANGGAIGKDQAEAVGKAYDAYDRFWTLIDNLGKQIAVQFAPYIEIAINSVTAFGQSMLNSEGAVSGAITGMISVVAFFIDAGVTGYKLYQAAVSELATEIYGLGMAFKYLVQPWKLFGSEFQSDLASYNSLAEETRKKLAGAFDTGPGAKMVEGLKKIQAESKKASDASKGIGGTGPLSAGKGTGDALKGTHTMQVAVEELNLKYKEQLKYLGQSSRLIDIDKLAIKGATAEQLNLLKAMDKQLTIADKIKNAFDALKDFAKGIADAVKTPKELFTDELKKLQLAKDKGLLTDEQFKKGQLAAGRDYKSKSNEVSFAGGSELGSEAAYTSIIQAEANSQQDSAKELVAMATAELAIQEKQLSIQEKLLEAFGKKEVEYNF